jgi:protein SCO1/2
MTRALEAVADTRPHLAAQVTPVFITVDPTRDDVARMRDYLRNFHPRMVGLTGSEQAIAEAAEAYHVSYSKVDPEEIAGQAGTGGDHARMDHGGYLMQHASYVYLMGPQGRHLAHVAHQAGAPRIAEMLRRHVDG